ncbi:uncharacterized protein [Euwallacea fornicatus]|uniref:uncharacterized protein isoform X2 n=1 Tax=Euwallacea fornicatus TaxID=995702 RepID=UPI00338FB37C
MNFVGEKEKTPKNLIRPLVQTAAVLGIIQGVVWTILSALSIAFYHMEAISFDDYSMKIYIYIMYIQNQCVNDQIIGAKEFSYFMYIYLILSITWFVVSSVTLWIIKTDRQRNYYDQSIITWSVVTSLVSLLDLILLSILSYDYRIFQNSEVQTQEKIMILTTIGIVMSLAARGFVLWVINIVFVVILSKHSYQNYQERVNKSPQRGNRPVIDAYSRSKPDLPWQTPFDNHKPFNNMGFRGDDDDIPFSSKSNPKTRENNRNTDYAAPFTPRLGQNEPSWNERPTPRNVGNGVPRVYANQEPPRIAKIGRQQDRRSPPLNVNPPYIPAPDYSPPGSPKVRGVLRPKSNYAIY